jgi:hypothetical protein
MIADQASSFGIGDMNGDGIADIVTMSEFTDKMCVYAGSGDGTFESIGMYDSGDHPIGVEIADFNGDGFNDIVSTVWWEKAVSVSFNDGAGNFSPRISYALPSGSYDVGVGDFNQDTKMDFVTANAGANSLSVFLNTTELEQYASGDYATEVRTLSADLSNFDDPDGLGEFSYQWQASSDGENWADIDGANAITYLIGPVADQSYRVEISYVDQGGFQETVYSAPFDWI